MGRVLFFLTLVAVAYYLHSTGILASINNGNQAIVGKDCELASPYKSGVYVGATKHLAAIPIDATIGNEYLRTPAKTELQRCLNDGRIVSLPDHTKVRVLGNDKVVLYAIPHGLVKVKILNGEYKGSQGWVERERVIDTPLHRIYNQFLRPGRLQRD